MLRRLSIGRLSSAIAIAPLPTKAQDGTAKDLGDVMSISLKDVVKPNIGFRVHFPAVLVSEPGRHRWLSSTGCR